MREIKFRAWHEINKEMVNFNPETLANDQYQARALLSLIAGLDKSGHVMQYTGLKDKNGKEIYEGDILKHDRFGTKTVDDIRDTFRTNSACYDSQAYSGTSESEVIGNIYENPELLEA